MRFLFFSCVLIACILHSGVRSQVEDYDDFVGPQTRIDVITEKGKKWNPSADYYCKYRVYDDLNATPCFCLSMDLRLKYSYNTSREVKRVDTKVPAAYWVHGFCFSSSIYVTISWPKYNPSEFLYLEPPKENFVLMIFKKNQTHVFLDEISVSVIHENGSKRPKSTITVSDTFLHLNFTTSAIDGIYVCDRPIELKGWTDAMDIIIEDFRFLLYNGITTRKETSCPKLPE